jgi:hypothetical protein
LPAVPFFISPSLPHPPFIYPRACRQVCVTKLQHNGPGGRGLHLHGAPRPLLSRPPPITLVVIGRNS